jgi:hypothetical protein
MEEKIENDIVNEYYGIFDIWLNLHYRSSIGHFSGDSGSRNYLGLYPP